MTAAKYRKAPDGEWLGFPDLRLEDIQHESFKESKHIAQALVNNRKGRIHLVMEHEDYQRFLEAVRKKWGNTSAVNVEEAAREAVEAWTDEVKKE